MLSRTRSNPGPVTLDSKTSGELLTGLWRRRGSRRTARVHCEIQLLKHFVRQGGSGPFFDYIGCSKKSCWLCWQLLGHFGAYTTKGTHRMIYPMWAFPAESLPSQIQFARALNATYKDMLTLINDKVLYGKDFSLRQNITHSSPRLNRPVTEAPTLGSVEPYTADTGITSSGSIHSLGRDSIATVPVVHIPGDPSEVDGASLDPQIVSVELFQHGDNDVFKRMSMVPFYINSTHEDLGEAHPGQRVSGGFISMVRRRFHRRGAHRQEARRRVQLFQALETTRIPGQRAVPRKMPGDLHVVLCDPWD
ncbi:hypothetical protein PG993_003716 [Apiospora rasikravindrae]|uniref:Uncharacterized protein n=1 Tax=Apiospora rasikravindrae TaxID=990691 RepID=A0ABR1U0A9_9PEZI